MAAFSIDQPIINSPWQEPSSYEAYHRQTRFFTRQQGRRPAGYVAASPGTKSFDYEEIAKRDKVNLDIFWLKDESVEDSDDLPDPDVLAQEIVDDIQTAFGRFSAVMEGVKE